MLELITLFGRFSEMSVKTMLVLVKFNGLSCSSFVRMVSTLALGVRNGGI